MRTRSSFFWPAEQLHLEPGSGGPRLRRAIAPRGGACAWGVGAAAAVLSCLLTGPALAGWETQRTQQMTEVNRPGVPDNTPSRHAPPLRTVLRFQPGVPLREVDPATKLERPGSPSYVRLPTGPATSLKFATLHCVYGSLGNHEETPWRALKFWYAARPALPDPSAALDASNARRDRALRQQLQTLLSGIVDRAVTACPDTYGAALEVGYGPDVWRQIDQLKQAQ